jgi:hypothetical protein
MIKPRQSQQAVPTDRQQNQTSVIRIDAVSYATIFRPPRVQMHPCHKADDIDTQNKPGHVVSDGIGAFAVETQAVSLQNYCARKTPINLTATQAQRYRVERLST